MLPRLKIGEMRGRVTIQRATTSDDVYGEPTETWEDVATDVPAEVIALSGREMVNAQQTKEVITHRVRMRYRADVTSADRFVYRGRILTITGPAGDPDMKSRETSFYCTESVAPEAPDS